MLHTDSGEVVLHIWNQCQPIPAAEIDYLFDPLRRYATHALSDSGPMASLGLGLYICREIVEAHGGMITVSSNENDGTTFTVRLPFSREAAA
jgi:signal transduction histidine kinase